MIKTLAAIVVALFPGAAICTHGRLPGLSEGPIAVGTFAATLSLLASS